MNQNDLEAMRSTGDWARLPDHDARDRLDRLDRLAAALFPVVHAEALRSVMEEDLLPTEFQAAVLDNTVRWALALCEAVDAALAKTEE